MGGFLRNYDAGTEQLIESGLGYFPDFDWYRVDGDRVLGLIIGSGVTFAFIVDHSGGPGTLTVGATASLSVGGARPTVTKLTDAGDWLYFDGGSTMTRLTISGTTITVGADVVTTNEWFYADPSVPSGLWEGHSTPVLDSVVVIETNAGDSHMDMMGIDVDHVLVVGVLSWAGSGEASGTVRRAYVLDLTTGAPSAGFPTTPFLSNWCAGQIDPGDGYWWAWDTWLTDGSDPSGLHLVLVSCDGTSLSVTDVTGYVFDTNTALVTNAKEVNLGLDTAGKWWLFAAENAQIEALWTDATPFTQRITNVKVDGTTATTVDYVSEQDVGGTYFPRVAVTDGCSSIDDGFMGSNSDAHAWTWQISDEHTRVESNGFSFLYEVDAPHQSGGGAWIGASDKRMLYLWWNSTGSVDVYVAAFIETAIPPSPVFDFVQSDDECNTKPITFDADDESGGFSTPYNTRDSYWHPILEYRWEWDDGTADVYTSSTSPVHTYRHDSETHVAGSQTADAETIFPSLIGEVGYYLPLLRARNSVGWSYAEGGWLIEVLECIPPPQRQFPRDDGLGISTLRSWPPPTTKQFGQRRGAISAVE